MSRSRLWLVGVACALLSFSLPLLAMNATADNDPQLRVLTTGDAFSALVVTDDARVLVVNSNDRGITRSAIGRIARPWEPEITTLIAPADDRAAVGLWEALRLPTIQQVIVVGVPGSDPVWSAIERESRERDVEVTYVGVDSIIDLNPLTLTLHPLGYLTIRQAGLVIAMSLGDAASSNPATIGIFNRVPELPPASELLILPAGQGMDVQHNVIHVHGSDMVTLHIGTEQVRMEGGRLVQPSDEDAN